MNEHPIIKLMFWIWILMMGLCIGFIGRDYGYKQGQIDCINGKIEYQLKEQADKTKEWVKK